jgi:lipoprotein-releasing system permease protein
MKLDVNFQIAFTHIRTRRKQTLIAALGVTVGIALFVFSNSIVVGVSAYSRENLFKSTPHLRIFRNDHLSTPLIDSDSNGTLAVITNPTFTTSTRNIVNPFGLIDKVREIPFVQKTAPVVHVDLFYSRGQSQKQGSATGVNAAESDVMFDIQGTMIAGTFQDLAADPNGIVIGKGLADEFHLLLDDNIVVTSAKGISRVLKVIGIFSTGNKSVDETRSYLHITTAQALISQGPAAVTDIYLMVTDPDSVEFFARELSHLTGYDVEDWKTANEDQLAQNRMLGTMTPLISFSILLVAAFGIYNIINMTITQKLNDIAILKANGFRGRDIVTIFLSEALMMGTIGTTLGLLIGSGLVAALSNVYVGPPVGYFPIRFEASLLFQAALFGLIVSAGAGFFPARKAAKVDPVKIFRK